MASKSNIEWTDASWTPIRARNRKTGKIGWHCEHATTGCEFCYAESMNKRLGTGIPFKPGHRNDIEIFLDEEMVTAPLRWRKPRMVFVCSMTDLFADFVTDEWISHVFVIMAMAHQHTFQVLTKRADRMQAFLSEWSPERLEDLTSDFGYSRLDVPEEWPLPNVWLGISAERQQEADERIPLLLQTPAAVRFVSLEPLLGAIDLTRVSFGEGDPRHKRDALAGQAFMYGTGVNGHPDVTIRTQLEKPMTHLDWVITGGESGPNARVTNPGWFGSIRDQCKAAGVALFHKQNGAWSFETRAGTEVILPDLDDNQCALWGDGATNHIVATRVGKKAAGRLLDGVEHSEFPVSTSQKRSAA